MTCLLASGRRRGILVPTAAGCCSGRSASCSPSRRLAATDAQSHEQIARGKYIFGAAAGCGCHTEPEKAATLLNAGGRKYDGPFGTVYATNITPDADTGIGKWTDDQIITAIRRGRRPNGERLIPVHPYPTFNGIAEEDLRALVAYLRSVPPGPPSQYAEEDHRADVRDRVPAGLARRPSPRARRRPPPRPRRGWRAASTWCARSGIAANVIRRAA